MRFNKMHIKSLHIKEPKEMFQDFTYQDFALLKLHGLDASVMAYQQYLNYLQDVDEDNMTLSDRVVKLAFDFEKRLLTEMLGLLQRASQMDDI